MIDEDGEFETDLGSLLSTNEGNLGLESETCDSYTAGVVLTPRFIPDLTLAVDYYDITVDNVIELFDNNLLLRNCYESAQAVVHNTFYKRTPHHLHNGQERPKP